jgi:hypothetical protein
MDDCPGSSGHLREVPEAGVLAGADHVLDAGVDTVGGFSVGALAPPAPRSGRDPRAQGVGLADCARRMGLAMNTIKRYDRAGAPGKLRRAAQYRPTMVDPYCDYLRKRRSEEPGVPVQQLLREIRELGYPGSSNLLVRYLNQAARTPRGRTCRPARPSSSCSAGPTA